MVRSVVVGAAADRHRQSVRSVIRENEQICGRFRAAVGAARMNRCLLGEEQIRPVQRKVAVDLIGRHLMVPFDSVLAAGIHHRRRSDDIRLKEDARVLDGAVHMGLRRKVHDVIRLLFLENLIDRVAVADIRPDEAEIRIVHHRLERREIARVRELVDADDPCVRMLLQHMEYEIRSDEAGAAGHNIIHEKSSLNLYHSKLLRRSGVKNSSVFSVPVRREEYRRTFRSGHQAGTGRTDSFSVPRTPS